MNEATMAYDVEDNTWVNYYHNTFGFGFSTIIFSLDAMMQPKNIYHSMFPTFFEKISFATTKL